MAQQSRRAGVSARAFAIGFVQHDQTRQNRLVILKGFLIGVL